MEDKEIYSLDKLISLLEQIRKDGEGILNFPSAFYCLALEIKTLKERDDEN